MSENLHPTFTDIFTSLGMITKPENSHIPFESYQKEATNHDTDKSVEIGILKQKIDNAITDIEKLIELSNDTPFVDGYLKGILNDLKR